MLFLRKNSSAQYYILHYFITYDISETGELITNTHDMYSPND